MFWTKRTLLFFLPEEVETIDEERCDTKGCGTKEKKIKFYPAILLKKCALEKIKGFCNLKVLKVVHLKK